MRIMEAPVIVHRWFEHGAGWAYAPALKPAKRELMILLDGELKNGTGRTADAPRTFHLSNPTHGDIVGCVAIDDRSSDTKAQGRRPTILRAALLPRMERTDAEERAVIEQLLARWPEQPGEDHTLTVGFFPKVPAAGSSPPLRLPRTIEGSTTRIPRSRLPQIPTMKVFVAILMLVIAAAVWLAAVLLRRHHSSDKSLQATIAEMQDSLDHWGENGSSQGDMVVDHFFYFLSQQAAGGKIPESRHPYIEFVRRLPLTPAKRKQKSWTAWEIDQALDELVARLSGNHEAANHHDGDAMVREVVQRMDYDGWRAPKSKNSFRPEDFDDDPGAEITKYVEKFRRSSERKFADASDAMKIALGKWNIGVKDSVHPLAVMRQFFAELRPPQVIIQASDSDAYSQFAARFKRNVGSLGWTCDDVNELNYALKRLGGEKSVSYFGNDGPSSGLVEAVQRRTEFTPPSDDVDDKTVPKELHDFVHRFNPSVP